MLYAIQNYAVSMYAEYTSLYYQFSDISNDVIQLDTWQKDNKLSLNVGKMTPLPKGFFASWTTMHNRQGSLSILAHWYNVFH